MSTKVVSKGLGAKITLESNAPEVLDALKNAIDRSLDAIGESAVGHAMDVIIREGRVDTGTMMNSIGHAQGEDFVAIGTDVEYAPYQELGTSRGIRPARFLTKAATQHTEEYRNLVKESLENA